MTYSYKTPTLIQLAICTCDGLLLLVFITQLFIQLLCCTSHRRTVFGGFCSGQTIANDVDDFHHTYFVALKYYYFEMLDRTQAFELTVEEMTVTTTTTHLCYCQLIAWWGTVLQEFCCFACNYLMSPFWNNYSCTFQLLGIFVSISFFHCCYRV